MARPKSACNSLLQAHVLLPSWHLQGQRTAARFGCDRVGSPHRPAPPKTRTAARAARPSLGSRRASQRGRVLGSHRCLPPLLPADPTRGKRGASTSGGPSRGCTATPGDRHGKPSRDGPPEAPAGLTAGPSALTATRMRACNRLLQGLYAAGRVVAARGRVRSGYAARARRSSTVDPSSVSRRSNSPAQSDERSGAASRAAAEPRPSSARTRTASSR